MAFTRKQFFVDKDIDAENRILSLMASWQESLKYLQTSVAENKIQRDYFIGRFIISHLLEEAISFADDHVEGGGWTLIGDLHQVIVQANLPCGVKGAFELCHDELEANLLV